MKEKYTNNQYLRLLIDAREKNEAPVIEKPIPKFAAADYCLEWLREQYPVIAEFKPLAIGITNDIERPIWMPVKSLKSALRVHTWTERYLTASAQIDSCRFALDGTRAGDVTELQRELAQRRLDARYPNVESVPKQQAPDTKRPVITLKKKRQVVAA